MNIDTTYLTNECKLQKPCGKQFLRASRTCPDISVDWGQRSRRFQCKVRGFNMEVSWNGGTQNWMIYVRENPIKIRMMTGGTPIYGNPHMSGYQKLEVCVCFPPKNSLRRSCDVWIMRIPWSFPKAPVGERKLYEQAVLDGCWCYWLRMQKRYTMMITISCDVPWLKWPKWIWIESAQTVGFVHYRVHPPLLCFMGQISIVLCLRNLYLQCMGPHFWQHNSCFCYSILHFRVPQHPYHLCFFKETPHEFP